MNVHRSMMLVAAVLVASTAPVFAGPCTDEIIRALLETGARSGPSAAESSAARLHRQPTPGSIAAAESAVGSAPAQTTEAVKAMVTAREADSRGDQSACEQALSEVKRLIGP
jgi:hypothetical protein